MHFLNIIESCRFAPLKFSRMLRVSLASVWLRSLAGLPNHS